MKVFISHNMSGLTDDKVKEIRGKAKKQIESYFGYSTDVEIIDNYTHSDAPENASRLWHLGKSIQQMAEADVVYFIPDNSDSQGCKVEKLICELYGIHILNIGPNK